MSDMGQIFGRALRRMVIALFLAGVLLGAALAWWLT